MREVMNAILYVLTRRMVIWPEAIKAQNSMATVSADGRAHWVLD